MRADTTGYDANIAKARKQLEAFKQDNLSLGGVLNQSSKSIMAAAAQYASFAAVLGTVAAGFQEAISEGTRMAKEMEGVRLAFDRINQPGLLDNLREATHNTVTDLELMKQAVKFKDFRLNLSQMGTFLAFAQQKAKDTGESVDNMVNSIVTGLGRQSLMILDNLGLSASKIRERMKETGDMTTAVAQIIEEKMADAGDYVETAAERAAQADTALKNAMEQLGETFMPLQEEGTKMFTALETSALKLLNDALTPLIPKLVSLKNTIGDIATSVSNSSIFDGYIAALGFVADKAAQAAGPLGKVYMLLKMIKGSSDGDLGAGAAVGNLGLDYSIDQIPEITVLGTKPTKTPKTPKGSTKNIGDTIQSQFDAAMRKGYGAGEKASDSGNSSAWQAYVDSINQGAETAGSSIMNLADAFKALNQAEGVFGEKDLSQKAKDTSKSFSAAASSISAVGSALNGIEDPTSKILGMVAQAIAAVAAGAGQAISAKDTTSSGWAWIGAAAAIAAEMVTIISTIHSATGYAQGGVIPGNSYSGDNQWARVNAGETILTRAQAGILANQLQGVGLNSMNLTATISGEQIRLALNNNGRRTGRGEYVTTHFAQ